MISLLTPWIPNRSKSSVRPSSGIVFIESMIIVVVCEFSSCFLVANECGNGRQWRKFEGKRKKIMRYLSAQENE